MDQDRDILPNAERVFWCHVLRTLPLVQCVKFEVTLESVQPWVLNQFKLQADFMNLEQLLIELPNAHAHANARFLTPEGVPEGVPEAVRTQWAQMKALGQTANTLMASSNFRIETKSEDKIVLRASRSDLISRCDLHAESKEDA
jgi:hypothetical protein